LTPTEAIEHGLQVNRDGIRRSAFELLSYPDLSLDRLAEIWPEFGGLEPWLKDRVENDARYAVYLDRQEKDMETYRRDEHMELPGDLDYAAVSGLSTELRTKLMMVRPRTIGHAGRVEGMTPAALTLLAARARRNRTAASSVTRTD
jgi:tRNA uridine 5-carboxymethylaminomethyl modification enzyme